MTDREKIRDWISIQTNKWEEEAKCITVFGGPKYTFYPDGNLRHVTVGEKVYHG